MRMTSLLALLAIAAGFGWIAATPWMEEPGTASAAAPGQGETIFAAPDLSEPTKSDLAPFTERPLFSAVRRPPPPEEPGAPLVDPRKDLLFGRYEVAGVVMLGDAAIAMLRDADSGALLRVRAGDTVETRDGDGADVLEITLESLTFARGAVTVVAPVKREGARTE